MNWLDAALAAVLLVSVISGLRKGFARMAIGAVTIAAALIGSCWMYGSVGYYFLEYVSHKALANLIGFVVVFCLVMAVGAVAGLIVEKVAKLAGLNWLNRLLGAGFGAVQAALVAIAIVTALMAFARHPPPRAVEESRLAPYVIDLSQALVAAAPRELRDAFEESYGKVKENWKRSWKQTPKRLPAQSY